MTHVVTITTLISQRKLFRERASWRLSHESKSHVRLYVSRLSFRYTEKYTWNSILSRTVDALRILMLHRRMFDLWCIKRTTISSVNVSSLANRFPIMSPVDAVPLHYTIDSSTGSTFFCVSCFTGDASVPPADWHVRYICQSMTFARIHSDTCLYRVYIFFLLLSFSSCDACEVSHVIPSTCHVPLVTHLMKETCVGWKGKVRERATVINSPWHVTSVTFWLASLSYSLPFFCIWMFEESACCCYCNITLILYDADSGGCIDVHLCLFLVRRHSSNVFPYVKQECVTPVIPDGICSWGSGLVNCLLARKRS